MSRTLRMLVAIAAPLTLALAVVAPRIIW